MLKESRALLHHVADSGEGLVLFRQYDEGGDELLRPHAFYMPRDTWRDMGEPSELTVTMQPGNRMGNGIIDLRQQGWTDWPSADYDDD